jgi:hypothetical protein
MRVGHHQQVQRIHAALRVLHPRHGVAAVAEDDHRLDVVLLVDLLGVDRHASNQRVEVMPGTSMFCSGVRASRPPLAGTASKRPTK